MKNIKYWFCYFITCVLVLVIGFFCIFIGYDNISDKLASGIYFSIGTSLIASFLVLALDPIKDFIKERYYKKIHSVVIDAGISMAYPKRDIDEYDKLMNNVRSRIFITGYSLNSFYDSYKDIITDSEKMKNVDIKIIFVNPESSFSRNREEVESRHANYFQGSIKRFINETANTSCQIRMLDSPLTTMIFCIDDILFVGPHLHQKSSKSTLTLKLDSNGWMYREYMAEFDRLWDSGTPIP